MLHFNPLTVSWAYKKVPFRLLGIVPISLEPHLGDLAGAVSFGLMFNAFNAVEMPASAVIYAN
jgi:hypothetical protein